MNFEQFPQPDDTVNKVNESSDTESTQEQKESLEQWDRLENHVFDEEHYYRIVDQKGYDDFIESGVIRSSPTGTDDHMVGSFNLGGRTTSFPSFSKGVPDFSYVREGHDNYIFESDIPMYRRGDTHPAGHIIGGRHWAYRPVDPDTNRVITELPKESVKNVYKLDAGGLLYLKKNQ